MQKKIRPISDQDGDKENQSEPIDKIRVSTRSKNSIVDTLQSMNYSNSDFGSDIWKQLKR